jgi:Fels-1 Prophage Protein-like
MRNVKLATLIFGSFVFMTGTNAFALNCKAYKADFAQGQKDGAADAKESYPKDVNQHGYAASASDGADGQCYRSAYNAAYDKAKRSSKGSVATSSAPAPAVKGRKFTKTLFSPASGVICDTLGVKYCADGAGISASFTQEYLGVDAAKRLAQEMAGADMSSFVLSNRVECRVKENACFRSKGSTAIDPVFTKVLFP